MEIKLTNKRNIELLCTPNCGGRITSMKFSNEEFLFFSNELNNMTKKYVISNDYHYFRKHIEYIPSGGYKCWISPQKEWGWPPYFDLELGKYSIIKSTKNSIEMLSPICRESFFQIKRNIVLNNSSIMISEQLQNFSNTSKKCGIWSVFQLKNNLSLQISTNKNSLFNMLSAPTKDVISEIDTNNSSLYKFNFGRMKEFKIGVPSLCGTTQLKTPHGHSIDIGLPKRENPFFGHGAEAEIYESDKYPYFELEFHSPLKNLQPNESIKFSLEIST